MLKGPDFKAQHLASLRAKDLGQHQQTRICIFNPAYNKQHPIKSEANLLHTHRTNLYYQFLSFYSVKEQARKSPEDTQVAAYTRFEKFGPKIFVLIFWLNWIFLVFLLLHFCIIFLTDHHSLPPLDQFQEILPKPKIEKQLGSTFFNFSRRATRDADRM